VGMRIWRWAAVIAPFFGGVAQGADAPALVHKAPPAPQLVQTPSPWSGCYVGAQLGGAQSSAHWHYKNLNPYDSSDPTGPLLISDEGFNESRLAVGAQAGCNYNIQGPWIVGIEGSWLARAMNRARDNGLPVDPGFTSTIATQIGPIGSLTPRLGYQLSPDWLLYLKGGYALALIETSGEVSPTFTTATFDWSDTKWHQGHTVGAGFEYRLFRNVTVGAEYDYYRFGSMDHLGAVAGGTITSANQVEHNVKADVQTVMARLNFYTDMPATTLAASPGSVAYTGTLSAFSNTEASFASWTGTRGANVFAPEAGKGYQAYSPTTIGINYEDSSAIKLETRIKSGYVYSHQGTPGQGATYEGPVDTQVALNATVLSLDSIRPIFGTTFNLPTGTSYLPNNLRFTRMDPDLVEVGSYGVGFNVNPTAGFVVGLNQTTALSISGGYAWQGVFVKEGVDLSAGSGLGSFDIKNRINPGDVFTANANLTTSFDKLLLLGTFAYMSETALTIDGAPSLRAGAKYVTNLAANYPINDRWAIALNGTWSFQERNEIPDLVGALAPEAKNSNNHLLIGSVDPSYQVTERLKIAANYSILWRSQNFYDPFEQQFIPAKIKNTVGASANYGISPTATIGVRSSFSWIHQNTGPFLETSEVPLALALLPPSLNYTSWVTSVFTTFRF
jgi:outer membrane immunogenic protein